MARTTGAELASEAAIYAENTDYSGTYLASAYDSYADDVVAGGGEPDDFQRWIESAIPLRRHTMEIRGLRVQMDASGVGHCWRNLPADDHMRGELETWIIEDSPSAGDEYAATNGVHYRVVE